MKIGDTVKVIRNRRYSRTTGGQTGRISEINSNSAEVIWDNPTCLTLNIYQNQTYGWNIELIYLELYEPTPKLPTEQRVANKCKKLWNNSSYVKKNPSFAY